MWINLNPGVEDANVTLRGQFESEQLDRFEGEWVYMSWVLVNKGRFEAERR